MPTSYGPATGNVLPGTPSEDVNKYVTWPLAQEFRKFLISTGVIGKDEKRNSYHDFLLSEESNSWAITYENNSGKGYRSYFVYKNDTETMVVVPIN